MKTVYYTCKKCNRRYEYNADVGYSRDNICGPFCDGILRGEEKSAARISALEAERDRAVELLTDVHYDWFKDYEGGRAWWKARCKLLIGEEAKNG